MVVVPAVAVVAAAAREVSCPSRASGGAPTIGATTKSARELLVRPIFRNMCAVAAAIRPLARFGAGTRNALSLVQWSHGVIPGCC